MIRTILLLCCFITCSCSAQELLVNTKFYTFEDGLTDREVFCVNQDNRGMVWVGTGNGLNLFDGKRFKLVKSMPKALSFGLIEGIKKSKDGSLWVQKENDLLFYGKPNESSFEPVYVKDESGANVALQLLNPKRLDQHLFFRDNIGRVYFRDSTGQINRYGTLMLKGLRDDENARPTQNHTILYKAFDSSELFELDSTGQMLNKYVALKDRFDYRQSSVDAMLVSLYFEGGNEFIQERLYSLNEGMLQPIELKRDGIAVSFKDVLPDRVGNIQLIKNRKGYQWLIVNYKLWLFDEDGNFMMDLSERLLKLTQGVKWGTNQLFIDHKDRLWISTGLGLFLIEVKESAFQNYLDKNNTSIRGIDYIDDSLIQVNTYQGVKVLNRYTEKLVKSFPYNGIVVAKDNNGLRWNGQHGFSLMVLDENSYSHRIIRFTGNKAHSGIVPHYDSLTNQLWVGTTNGLALLDRSTETYHYLEKYNQQHGLGSAHITFFYRNKQGLWVGSQQGVYLLKEGTENIEHYTFPNNHILHFYEDTDGAFWLATRGGGLLHWDTKTDSIQQYTTHDGLSHNVIYAVYEDNHQNLWLPSNNGLMRFNKENKEVGIYHTADGIPDREFNTYSHFQAPDGRLYFGGINGLTAFYPDRLKTVVNDAEFIISQLQQFDSGKGTLIDKTQEFFHANEVLLKPGDKFFTLHFSLLDYFASEPIYAWKIEGLDEDWNFQTENSIRINALPYGNYTLRVKAKGGGGQWAQNQLNIPVRVLQPFYDSRWFYWGVGFGVCLLGFFYYKWRVYRLRKNELRLKKIVEDRTRTISEQNKILSALNAGKDQFFSIIGHDLRGPLLSLRGLSKKVNFLIKNDRFEEVYQLGEKVEDATQSITKLLDNLLNWALVQKGKFPYRPENIVLQQAVDEALEVYKTVAEVREINLVSHLNNGLEVYADKNALSTILRNLIDNALKFTEKEGTVTLDAVNNKDYTRISVVDTGVGMTAEQVKRIFELGAKRGEHSQASKSGTGLGLILCKDLTKINKGSIKIESQPGKGTIFTIDLPTGGQYRV